MSRSLGYRGPVKSHQGGLFKDRSYNETHCSNWPGGLILEDRDIADSRNQFASTATRLQRDSYLIEKYQGSTSPVSIAIPIPREKTLEFESQTLVEFPRLLRNWQRLVQGAKNPARGNAFAPRAWPPTSPQSIPHALLVCLCMRANYLGTSLPVGEGFRSREPHARIGPPTRIHARAYRLPSKYSFLSLSLCLSLTSTPRTRFLAEDRSRIDILVPIVTNLIGMGDCL